MKGERMYILTALILFIIASIVAAGDGDMSGLAMIGTGLVYIIAFFLVVLFLRYCGVPGMLAVAGIAVIVGIIQSLEG